MNGFIVPLIGMHRSGTSALAGALHSGGVKMGDEETFIPRPSPENPRGFYEDIRFRRLNDKLLEKSGYVVKRWGIELPPISDGFLLRRRRRRLIRQCGASGHWGWKDPRTCLVFDTWLRELEKAGLLGRTRILFIHRHPFAVARSLERRNHLPLHHGLKLWTLYNKTALETIERWGVPSLSVGYESVLNEQDKKLGAVHQFLEGAFSIDKGKGFLDPDLQRNKPARSGLPDEIEGAEAGETINLYERLRSIT